MVGEFARDGTGREKLREPFGIAVDQRSGDVYVVDTNNWRVAKFTATGAGSSWRGAGGRRRRDQGHRSDARASTPRVSRAMGQDSSSSLRAWPFDNGPSSSSRGDVYVVEIYDRRVQKFTSTGRFLLTFGGGVNQTASAQHDYDEENVCPVHPGDACGICPRTPPHRRVHPGTAGDFYVIRHGITGVRKYTPSEQPNSSNSSTPTSISRPTSHAYESSRHPNASRHNGPGAFPRPDLLPSRP
jgi:hypothetical protein